MQLPPTMLYEKRDRIAIITINRPEALNAFTPDMLRAMDAAFADFNKDPNLWVAIFTAKGERSFCAGMDLKEAIGLVTSGDEMGYEDHTKRPFSDVFKPIIGAVNGYCIAGGLEFLQGTDLRIAAEHATFGLGEVRWGIIPTGGSHIRLPRQIPYAKAMEMLMIGDAFSARQALEMGLLNYVVAKEQLMAKARELAHRLAENGPLAVQKIKEGVMRTSGVPLEQALEIENEVSVAVLMSKDAREGPRAFKEKRKPRFTGE